MARRKQRGCCDDDRDANVDWEDVERRVEHGGSRGLQYFLERERERRAQQRKSSGRNPGIWRAAAVALVGLLLFLFVQRTVFGQNVVSSHGGFILDPPVTWTLGAQTDQTLTWYSGDGTALLRVLSLPGDTTDSASALADFQLADLGATGDVAPFRYHDADAIFADIRFTIQDIAVRGYAAFIDGDDRDFAILSVASEGAWAARHDEILSALDSFGRSPADASLPGPVSTFFSDGPPGRALPVRLQIGDASVVYQADPVTMDASQVLIEREARILAQFSTPQGPQGPWLEAWRRFYRVVYRDSVSAVIPLVEQLLAEPGFLASPDLPSVLLDWLQEFGYGRTGTLADFQSPIGCIVDGSGDCDSLGLLYAIMLHELGYDAVLMVSLVHAHAMVGVAVDGAGARFPFEGSNYLVAELTADVEIGQIDASMANSADWFGVRLDPLRGAGGLN